MAATEWNHLCEVEVFTREPTELAEITALLKGWNCEGALLRHWPYRQGFLLFSWCSAVFLCEVGNHNAYCLASIVSLFVKHAYRKQIQ